MDNRIYSSLEFLEDGNFDFVFVLLLELMKLLSHSHLTDSKSGPRAFQYLTEVDEFPITRNPIDLLASALN